MRARIVSFHCTLRDKVGKVISLTFNRDVITQIDGPDALLKGLAKGLQKLKKGQKKRIFLSAEQAYGLYDPQLVIHVPKKRFSHPARLRIGQEIVTQYGRGESRSFRVTQISPRLVTLDGNHPLAGQDLFFDVEAVDARDATVEEIAEASIRNPAPIVH